LKLDETLMAEVDRIALLSKADLVTAMVGEFPELQGVMGRIYASATETASVAQGIEEHYWPLTADGPLPRLPAAALVSIADKLDSLAGNFRAGNVPTGSQDPYGLRRAAVGVLRILKDRGWSLDLGLADGQAMRLFGEDDAGARERLDNFMKQRWSALQEAAGFRVDAIRAVLVSCPSCRDPLEWEGRLRAVTDVLPHPDFGPLVEAFRRASNILKQAQDKKLTSSLETPALGAESDYGSESEKVLYGAVQAIGPEAKRLCEEKKYGEALRALVRFRGPVDRFFKEVMVMDPDETVRTNRLALLAHVRGPFGLIADLSQIQGNAPAAAKEGTGKVD
jgi:glycyl-tRNA synthetase beta chain